LSAREDDVAEHFGAWSPFSQQNRLAWEEIADVRTHRWSNRLYTAEFFAAGGCSLDQRVIDALGQLDAARVLHLMCSTGEESLSLAVLGARVLAVDISERQVELARSKAQAAGVRVDFAAADIGALPVEIAAGGFDVVYTGGGVLSGYPTSRCGPPSSPAHSVPVADLSCGTSTRSLQLSRPTTTRFALPTITSAGRDRRKREAGRTSLLAVTPRRPSTSSAGPSGRS
jgi:SAM-dependent methyltransferase